ncbi:MAG TPA: hypothetical protein VEK12_10750 [Alphaproteobacteria bacterium]|nr:hypothetical protein [Alphaproteobacteria bacterium]
MNLEAFKQSLQRKAPPPGLSGAAQGLWWDAKGDWQKAHASAQGDDGAAGAWVHAYLHRKEGDRANAGYWYRRAGKAAATGSLAEEWQAIARALLREG